MDNKELIHRLNRASGQIQSIKAKLESGEDVDCVLLLQQLKASINALKKFGEAYMSAHLEECLTVGRQSQDMANDLKKVISGAFSL